MNLNEFVISFKGKEAASYRGQERKEKTTPGYYAGMEAGRTATAGSKTKSSVGFALGKSSAIQRANREKRQEKLRNIKSKQQDLQVKQKVLKDKEKDVATAQESIYESYVEWKRRKMGKVVDAVPNDSFGSGIQGDIVRPIAKKFYADIYDQQDHGAPHDYVGYHESLDVPVFALLSGATPKALIEGS